MNPAFIKGKARESGYLCLGIVPEKRATKAILMDVFNSHWGSIQSSSSTPDGSIEVAPFDASTVPLLTPSGLSRVQFLAAAQSMTLPFFPTYCKGQGGLVSA